MAAYVDIGTKACPDIGIDAYVRNLTSSYAGQSNETYVVATSVLMLMLAAGFLALSLFSRVANLSSVHHPLGRLLLSGAISLFLPIMSYLFSEAKMANECMEAQRLGVRGGSRSPELPPRAREILTWMLLVELLRRKVEAVNLAAEGIQRYIGVFTNGATVGWLGYLVFANVKGTGRVAVFGFLWIVCATKWVQRFVFAKVLKNSLSYDMNAQLVSCYMDQMMVQLRQGVAGNGAASEEKLETCEYVVMGEEKLVSEASGPRGYRLHDLDKVTTVVTVGRVWRLANVGVEEGAARPLLQSDPSLKRLCLSMALFKLLRRRIERLPAMAKEETDHCRDLILQGLFQEEEEEDGGSIVLEVLNNEVDFLSEYYHSVHPVVLASPYFFVLNYLVVPVVVCCLCATTTVLSGSGHVLFAFHTIKADNYAIRYGIFRVLRCLLERALTSPQAFFPAIDVIISYLLFTAFFLEQLIEFVVFLLSNWFMVSLLCRYVAKDQWRHRSVFPGAIRFISWARRRLRHPSNITLKQLSVLSSFWHPATLPSAALPREAKPAIVKRFSLAAYGYDGNHSNPIPLSKGGRALEMPGRQQFMHLSWFCNIECVAEAILTWHIATSLLLKEMEMRHPQRKRKGRPDVVATRLSNYCAYLVGSCPELLPGHPEGTKRVFSNMKKDLMKELGFWGYHFASKRARHNKIMMLTHDRLRLDRRDESMTVVQKGIVLGKALIDASSKGSDQPVWELLADVWVELIAYGTPSSGDQHVKGHQEALARGSEVMTLLWALATHTGITRPPPTMVAVEMIDDGVCPA